MQKKIHIPLIVEQDEDGIYIVYTNILKGCHAQGKTIEEAMERIEKLIRICADEQKDLIESYSTYIGVRDFELSI